MNVPAIAVSGASGLVGQRLLPLLADDPHVDRVIALDVREPAQRSTKLEFHRIDIAGTDLRPVLEGVDVVVHLAGVVVMFWRPLQTLVVMRMLGARRATPDQAQRLEPAWRSVAQQLGIRPRRYALAVLPSDALNAFACGGSLLVVTAYAIDTCPATR